ncbi:MAG: HAD family hydrolase [Clostridiales bacterium]|nr:HAD family hydrolase [Clostridiales bacterium]
MIKAFFVDFYGTLAHEDGKVVKQVSKIIYDTGKAESTSEIDSYWWREFQSIFNNAYGENFMTQRDVEIRSIERTVEHFQCPSDPKELAQMLFAQWVAPELFEDTKDFFEKSPLPIYVVSNIDTEDVKKAIAFNDLTPFAVFTSEDACSYKPRPELFELALRETGLSPDEVIHIGDSVSSDFRGASSVGIRALWLNRFEKPVPKGVECITSLTQAFDRL